MANNIYIAPNFAPTNALITTVDTVVDAIRAADVPGINTNIAAVISAKEKSLMGGLIQRPLKDYFDDVANIADPNADKWVVVEDGGSNVKTNIIDFTYGYCEMQSGAAGEDAIIHTYSKYGWGLSQDDDVTEIYFKTSIFMTDLTGEYAVGLIKNDSTDPDANTFGAVGNRQAGIHCNNDLVNAVTDLAGLETTDLSAYFSDGTFAIVEIVVTAANVKFYIDETLRATHSTKVPVEFWRGALASKNTNGINGAMRTKFVEIWPT